MPAVTAGEILVRTSQTTNNTSTGPYDIADHPGALVGVILGTMVGVGILLLIFKWITTGGRLIRGRQARVDSDEEDTFTHGGGWSGHYTRDSRPSTISLSSLRLASEGRSSVGFYTSATSPNNSSLPPRSLPRTRRREKIDRTKNRFSAWWGAPLQAANPRSTPYRSGPLPTAQDAPLDPPLPRPTPSSNPRKERSRSRTPRTDASWDDGIRRIRISPIPHPTPRDNSPERPARTQQKRAGGPSSRRGRPPPTRSGMKSSPHAFLASEADTEDIIEMNRQYHRGRK